MRKLLLVASLTVAALPASAVDLMGVYELAITNDPNLRAADFRRQAIAEATPQARAALLPALDGTAARTLGESRQRFAGERFPSTDVDTEFYQISLYQSLYDDANFGRLRRARAEASQGDANFEVAYQEFLLRVAERYFTVLTALDSVQFAEAEQTALQRQFEQADQRFEVGLAAVTDVHEARATYDAARARVILAENALEDAREALREITGARFEHYSRLQDELPLEIPDPPSPEAWVDLAIQHNPELEARRLNTEIATADVRTARAGHLPSLDLVGNYTRNINNEYVARDPATQDPLGTTSLRVQGWQVGLQLNVPIFQGFAVNSRTRQARHLLDASNEELEQALRAVVRQTENAFRGVRAGTQEIEARHQALISAESAVEATQAGFEVGTRTIVDVLLAEQRYYQAQRDYSQARHEYLLNHLRLNEAAGLLDERHLVYVNQLLRP